MHQIPGTEASSDERPFPLARTAVITGAGSARGIGSLGPPASGSRPSTGCRSAPASSAGSLRSSGVSGEAVVTVEGEPARSSAPVAGGEGIASG